VSSGTTGKVRLQIRVPALSRTITCIDRFMPESTLQEVRRHALEQLPVGNNTRAETLPFDDELPESRILTEEQRVAREARQRFRLQTESLIQQAIEARQQHLPQEETITFRMAAPPRTLFTQGDMHLTLHSAGLCPSASLIMESPQFACSRDSGPNQVGAEDEAPADHAGDAESSSDEELPDLFNRNTLGRSIFGQRSFASRFGANWFGQRGSPAPHQNRLPAPEQSSEISAPQADQSEQKAEQSGSQDRRAMVLAALERRGAIIANAGSAESGNNGTALQQDARSSLPAHSSAGQAKVASTTEQKRMEQREILDRIKEEREDYLVRRVPVSVESTHTSPSSSSSTGPAQSRDAQLLQARQAYLCKMQESSSSCDPVTVNSQGHSKVMKTPAANMGSTDGRRQREMERVRILQSLDEDRQSFMDRKTPAKSAAGPKPSQESNSAAAAVDRKFVSSSSTQDTVRLTVRCAHSGQSVVTTAFAPVATLADVRDFAASQLCGRWENSQQMDLVIPFLRRTISAASTDMQSSLEDMGLCPSATLLLQRPSNSTNRGVQTASDVQSRRRPLVASSTQEQIPDAATSAAREARRQACAQTALLRQQLQLDEREQDHKLLDGEVEEERELQQLSNANSSGGNAAQLSWPSSEAETGVLAASASSSSDQRDVVSGPGTTQDTCELRVRLPDGRVRQLRLVRQQRVGLVLDELLADLLELEVSSDEDGGWILVVPFPRQLLEGADLDMSLDALNLWPRGMLIVQHRSQLGQVLHGRSQFHQRRGQYFPHPDGLQDDQFMQWMDNMDWSESMGQAVRSDTEMNSLIAQLHSFVFTDAAEASKPYEDEGTRQAHDSGTPCAGGKSSCPKSHTDQVVCAICRCEYTAGDKLASLPCKHAFHEKCLHKWLKHSIACCLCKARLQDPGSR